MYWYIVIGVIFSVFVLDFIDTYPDISRFQNKIVAVQHRPFSSMYSRWEVPIKYSQYLLQEQERVDSNSLKLSLSDKIYR